MIPLNYKKHIVLKVLTKFFFFNFEITNNIYVIKLIFDYKGETGNREYLVKNS
jgi:hypothetical protein